MGRAGLKERRAPWRRLLRRLQDPRDVQAALCVAAALLLFEAVLCPLIIAKVPCESCMLSKSTCPCMHSLCLKGWHGCRHGAGLGGVHATGGGLSGGEGGPVTRACTQQLRETPMKI